MAELQIISTHQAVCHDTEALTKVTERMRLSTHCERVGNCGHSHGKDRRSSGLAQAVRYEGGNMVAAVLM